MIFLLSAFLISLYFKTYFLCTEKVQNMLLLKVNNHNTPNILFNKMYINFDVLYSCSTTTQ